MAAELSQSLLGGKRSQPETKYLLISKWSPKYCFFWATSLLENLVPYQPTPKLPSVVPDSLAISSLGVVGLARGWGRGGKGLLESKSFRAGHPVTNWAVPTLWGVSLFLPTWCPLSWLLLYPTVPFTSGLPPPLALIRGPAQIPTCSWKGPYQKCSFLQGTKLAQL